MTAKENQRTSCAFFRLALLVLFLLLGCSEQATGAGKDCRPTPPDEIGPFYRPDAPIREAVGEGYLLTGTVLSAGDCRPLPKTRIEFWLVNPQGQYDDAHRATVFADADGRYRFRSNRPTDYVNRKPHIHILVTAEGHEQLITQHYPKENATEAVFDLVLEKSPAK
ncbi:MAG: dioxygenase family protein [Desulfobulbaceae bacterium]